MPMDFPDLNSLKRAAQVHRFRQPYEDETEVRYRTALADHVQGIDFVESCEIRNGVGWDKFNDKQNTAMLERRVGSGELFKLMMETDSHPPNP